MNFSTVSLKSTTESSQNCFVFIGLRYGLWSFVKLSDKSVPGTKNLQKSFRMFPFDVSSFSLQRLRLKSFVLWDRLLFQRLMLLNFFTSFVVSSWRSIVFCALQPISLESDRSLILLAYICAAMQSLAVLKSVPAIVLISVLLKVTSGSV